MPVAAWALTLLTGLLWAPPAHAHILQGEAAGFLTGLGHPISGLDHVLAMIAVGLWGAQLGAPALWLLPVTFPMVMALGGMLGLIGLPLLALPLAAATGHFISEERFNRGLLFDLVARPNAPLPELA